MRYVCLRKCFYVRSWEKGEILNAGPGEKVPRHFVPEKEYKAPKTKPIEEPNTFSGMQKAADEEAKKLMQGRFASGADDFLA